MPDLFLAAFSASLAALRSAFLASFACCVPSFQAGVLDLRLLHTMEARVVNVSDSIRSGGAMQYCLAVVHHVKDVHMIILCKRSML